MPRFKVTPGRAGMLVWDRYESLGATGFLEYSRLHKGYIAEASFMIDDHDRECILWQVWGRIETC